MSQQDAIEVVIIDDETHVSNAPTDTRILTAAGKTIKAYDSAGWSTDKFKHVFAEGDTFFHLEHVEVSVVYNAKEGESSKLKFEIDSATFEKLPASLQALYEKVVTKEKRKATVDKPIHVFDLNDYTASTPELIIYERDDVIQALPKFNFRGDNKQALVTGQTSSSYRNGSLTVTFFKEPYEGKMRKVFDKKQNGQTYADGRGRMWPDYPTEIDKITISQSMIPEFFAHSKAEMEAKMQDYFDHITMTSMLKN